MSTHLRCKVSDLDRIRCEQFLGRRSVSRTPVAVTRIISFPLLLNFEIDACSCCLLLIVNHLLITRPVPLRPSICLTFCSPETFNGWHIRRSDAMSECQCWQMSEQGSHQTNSLWCSLFAMWFCVRNEFALLTKLCENVVRFIRFPFNSFTTFN